MSYLRAKPFNHQPQLWAKCRVKGVYVSYIINHRLYLLKSQRLYAIFSITQRKGNAHITKLRNRQSIAWKAQHNSDYSYLYTVCNKAQRFH
jgi:hypothetical protein